MIELGGFFKSKDDFSLDANYNWIYYMGVWGNILIRPGIELVPVTVNNSYGEDETKTSTNVRAAILYGYDFGSSFHVFPCAGISFNFIGVPNESGDTITIGEKFSVDAVVGAKIFFKRFELYGEYKYNLLKNDSNRLSLGITFAFGHSYIPTPPAPSPAPRSYPVYPAPSPVRVQPVPQVRPKHYPSITSEELQKVELAYAATVRDIERQGKRIYIGNAQERAAFIRRYQGNPDTASTAQLRREVFGSPASEQNYYDSSQTSEKDIVAMAKNEPNDFIKVRMIHDWVSDNLAYDYDLLWWMDNVSGQNAVFTFGEIVRKERGVCLEYAIAFYYLMDAAGINTYLISDYSKPGIGHAYNMVIINGTGYIIDTTWDSKNQYQNGRFVTYNPVSDTKFFMLGVSESYKLRGW
jgi:transglutaminase-like putative cysteine protease